MFNKKECQKCRERISEKSKFCPNCGFPSSKNYNDDDWGMLGKDDYTQDVEDPFMMPFGGISGRMINKMFNSAMKMLEKEMTREMTRVNSPAKRVQSRTNIKLMINGKEVNLNNLPNQQQHRQQNQQQIRPRPEKIPVNNLSSDKIKEMSSLPKEEPETNIRRLSNKVIYEINMPEVKSIKDISIIKLENSIEIKALGKKKVYFKLIPINLPIADFNLDNGRLILELETR